MFQPRCTSRPAGGRRPCSQTCSQDAPIRLAMTETAYDAFAVSTWSEH